MLGMTCTRVSYQGTPKLLLGANSSAFAALPSTLKHMVVSMEGRNLPLKVCSPRK